MPELPEVECLVRQIRPHITNRMVTNVRFFRTDLREPIAVDEINRTLLNQKISTVDRRSKYFILRTPQGNAIIHLGMSGNLLLNHNDQPQHKHTHVIIEFSMKNKPPYFLHFVDPRRFGRLFACRERQLTTHKLFLNLGPEPLTTSELDKFLWQRSRNKSQAIKTFLMDAKNIVGIGNIYANEALYQAKIHPLTPVTALSKKSFKILVDCIQETLQKAITAGGTSFRDFKHSDGKPGYFSLEHHVYERLNQPCHICGNPIQHLRHLGRATYFCAFCQK